MTKAEKALFKLNEFGYQDPKDKNKVKFHSVGYAEAGEFIAKYYNLLRSALDQQAKVIALLKAARDLKNIMREDVESHFGKKYGGAFVKALAAFDEDK